MHAELAMMLAAAAGLGWPWPPAYLCGGRLLSLVQPFFSFIS
jgi:hypothetical protein